MHSRVYPDGSHGFLQACVCLMQTEFEGQKFPHDNPIFLTGLLLSYCLSDHVPFLT